MTSGSTKVYSGSTTRRVDVFAFIYSGYPLRYAKGPEHLEWASPSHYVFGCLEPSTEFLLGQDALLHP